MIKKKELNTFKNLVKKAVSYKPKEVLKKPKVAEPAEVKAPSVKELNKVYKLDKKNLIIK